MSTVDYLQTPCHFGFFLHAIQMTNDVTTEDKKNRNHMFEVTDRTLQQYVCLVRLLQLLKLGQVHKKMFGIDSNLRKLKHLFAANVPANWLKKEQRLRKILEAIEVITGCCRSQLTSLL